MVHITFYNTYSNRNVINKTMEPVLSTTAQLYDETNLFSPELLLAWNNTYVNSANYFYIQEFNRYYFLEDVVAEPGGAARIKGNIDVLYTYKNSIKMDEIVITRAYYADKQPNIGYSPRSTYIKDSKLPVKPQRDIEVQEFTGNNIFNLNSATSSSWNFVLNIMGRKPN